MTKKNKSISPLHVSLLHFLPSLILLVMIVIGFVSLTYSAEHKNILGVQSALPQIKTETVEDRIKELTEIDKSIDSEAVNKAKEELSR